MSPPSDPTNPAQTEILSEKAAVISGAVAGCLAPLTTVAVTAFNQKSSLHITDIPWILMFIFGVIGAVVVFFLAERNRRHVFTYAIAAPFLVLGIVKTHDAELARTEVDKKEEKNAILLSAYEDASDQAKQTNENAEKSRLDRPRESLSYPPEAEATVDFENPSI